MGKTVVRSDRREARRQNHKGEDGDGETEADEGKVGADSAEEEQVVVELELAGTSRWSAPRALVTTVGAFSTGQMNAPILPVTSPGAEEDDEVAVAVAVDRTAAGDRVHGPQPSGPL